MFGNQITRNIVEYLKIYWRFERKWSFKQNETNALLKKGNQWDLNCYLVPLWLVIFCLNGKQKGKSVIVNIFPVIRGDPTNILELFFLFHAMLKLFEKEISSNKKVHGISTPFKYYMFYMCESKWKTPLLRFT